jgi:murein DD-endopeptidase MepM/ murein hydrolase activator NlpD
MKWLLRGLCTATTVLGLMASLTSCNDTAPEATPTPASSLAPTQLPTPTDTSAETGVAATVILPTRTPRPTPAGTPTPDPSRNFPDGGVITTTYTVRRGDTLSGIAAVTGTSVEELQRLNNLRNANSLQAGQDLFIFRHIIGRGLSVKLIPDSELVNGPSAADFDLTDFVSRYNGYLGRYTDEVAGDRLTGVQIVQRVADQYSVHPRLLLAALEFTGGWVTQQVVTSDQLNYPLGYKRTNVEGLYIQLSWAALRLNEGYYGWRLNNRNYVRFDDGSYAFMGDRINAGTAALQNYLAAIGTPITWVDVIGEENPRAFIQTYRRLFGDPWLNDYGPPVPPDTRQPALALPWSKGEMWFFTGGPHATWGTGTPWGALDFTSVSAMGCNVIPEWVTAMADGVITRSTKGEVVQSLDPSGDDRIGWSVLYLHIASRMRVRTGISVKRGYRIGHPSCEGGLAQGAHMHLARRYNGEWINIEGDIPFEIGGWVAGEAGSEYDGVLIRDNQRREACECKLPTVNGIGW